MTSAKIHAILGKTIDVEEGNELLSSIQEQRCAGTLDRTLDYPEPLIEKGLKYLRANYPVDEDAAIIARVDQEFDDQFRVAQTNTERSKYAHSFLEETRKKNEKKHEKEQKKREIQEKQWEQEGKTKTGVPIVHRRTERALWVKTYEEKATGLNAIPEMSTLSRLAPSGIFTLVVVGLSLLFAQNYTSPSQQARLWPELPPAAATMITLIGINLAVFIAYRLPPMWAVMNRNFIVVPAYPYAFSILGAAFAHHQVGHMLGNMVGMWLIGTRLHDDIGRGPFLALVFSAAVLSSYASMSGYILNKILTSSTLGASGVLCAIIAASCVVHEGRKIQILALPPEWTQGINTGIVLAIFMLHELYSLRKKGLLPKDLLGRGETTVDHMGHLAGYTTGLAAGCMIRSTDPHWKSVKRESFLMRMIAVERKDETTGSDPGVDKLDGPAIDEIDRPVLGKTKGTALEK